MAKVLIIGSGAREHALAQSFLRSPQVTEVIVSPGNPGMTDAGIQLGSIAVNDLDGLVALAQDAKIDLTMAGSEEALILGVVDRFKAAGLRIFGPNQIAAQLEGSKTFAKELLMANDIPTAQSVTVQSFAEAQSAVPAFGLPIVMKQDGLALGKGVTILKTDADVASYLQETYHAQADAVIVIEEYLAGVEFSVFSFVGPDGVVHTPVAQDHKRLLDGNEGPNTGGMGAYSPVRWLRETDIERAINELVTPTLTAMTEAGTPFEGILYTGVMLTETGPKVIEFNVRFGDPEAQVVLPQLTSDFYQLLTELLDGKQPHARWQTDDVYVGVVLAAPGYPVAPEKGILLPKFALDNVTINYAGVTLKNNQLVSSGGRVMTVVTAANTATDAQAKLYTLLDNSQAQLTYRHDIAYQAVDAENMIK
ncbi:phosphoribosylamine--glycine ligase [Weissella tructae]|uniref:Phosphoribosylamine--glycine ligase n=2 Tax=Weissella TaxID=46255 RepID=A0A075TZB2_9LACO|nr:MULTISPECIES: phosphoribosylamine--glycine ligase [Weissella]AIG65615.1 Phosphoribosylamine--glycine ligase [Weissella tructae]AIM62930.1 Phosphoribosylamine--glycine ligase [Weissella ceti]AIM64328.1 Phosphoribosylamine--glycine ligase [Weissella ceti]ELA06931.1 phosphoribosylamine--glycine ligase [Weissella ceti NC36]QVV90739.1 phosphoribosylamine--glycine ligase [Weissella tructae]